MTPDTLHPFALVLTAAMFWFTPTLSRPGVFFGVTVSPAFRETDLARACVRHYRVVVFLGAGVAFGVMIAASSPRAKALALAAHTLASTAMWVATRHRVLPHAQSPVGVRAAALVERDTRVPGGMLLLVGPFVIVGIAALVVWANWEVIPERFPSMSRSGNGRMTPKSVNGVFGPFVFIGALLGAFTMQTVFLMNRTRTIAASGPAFEAEARFKRRTAQQSLAATYLMAAGPSWFAVQRVLGDGTPGLARGVWIGVIVCATLAVTIWMIRVGQGGQRAVPAADGQAGDATPDGAWKAGLIYFNPGDSAVFVERRFGVGWTLNFGSPWAWVLLGLALGFPMIVLRLMR
jgi:uncharacterized membrane protein